MTSWLSDSEVKDVTHRRQPAAQARVLQSWGVTFRRRPDGMKCSYFLAAGLAIFRSLPAEITQKLQAPAPQAKAIVFAIKEALK